jgi:RNA polymerase sigma-70 factor (ECF subfamily)
MMGQAAATSSGPDPGIRAGELFEAHGRMVYALCRLILRDSVEAEDAAQQTFLSAYRSLLNGRGPDQPEAWLATIARNECRHRISRRTPSTVELLEADGQGAPDPSGLVDSRAEMEALCAAVAELPTKQREAIVLREFYGLSYREVAAALGTTGTAVESAIFKSRRSLQARLRPMRDAAGSLALPLSLHDSLSQLIPGFSQAAAGGGGVALVAKLSVPVGVKALVAGLSVVALGGTMAVGGHVPGNHASRRAVAHAPQHALVTPRPTPTAAPQVHVARRATHVARTMFVAARPTTRKAAHHAAATTEHRSRDEQQQQSQENQRDDGESNSDSTSHQSPGLTSSHSSRSLENSNDAQQQQASDARDAAEHAADAPRDAADKARDAAQTD